MSQSTDVIGPFDSFPTTEKVRMMVGVPDALHKQITNTFTRRGVQDKILARLFYIFYSGLESDKYKARLAQCVTESDKENLLNDLLNEIANYDVQSTNPQSPDADSSQSVVG